jgi:Cyclin, N-terminal domain/Cyclin, C-terminal domain
MMDIDEPDEDTRTDFGADHRALLQDNLQALLRQEQSGKYSCSDYLHVSYWTARTTTNQQQKQQQKHQQQQVGFLKRKKFGPTTTPAPSTAALLAGTTSSVVVAVAPTGARIDEYCREQIVEWSFRVVDYFRIDREVVSVSMSYLDRYLSCCPCDRSTFKLAATATLYLAVKILYPCKLADLGILSDLSRGEFDMMDVCQTERIMLDTLGWNLHPPTATSFFSIFLDYFFATRVVTISSADMDDIYDVAGFFCELSACDYSFTHVKESTIAVAAILNSLEGMFGPENRLESDIVQFAVHAHLISPQQYQQHPRHIHQEDNNDHLTVIRNRLWDLYERSEECAIHQDKFPDEHDPTTMMTAWQTSIFVKKSSLVSSPVSVSTKPCHSAIEFGRNRHSLPPHEPVACRNESW